MQTVIGLKNNISNEMSQTANPLEEQGLANENVPEEGELRVIDGELRRCVYSGYTLRQFYSHSTPEKGAGPGWDTRWRILRQHEIMDPKDLPNLPDFRWELANLYTYECVEGEKLYEEVYSGGWKPKLDVEERPSQTSFFKGFSYFAPHHLHEQDRRFILARQVEIDSPFNIVGVIKTGSYGENIPGLLQYTAINYIDVKEGHKRRGIQYSRELILHSKV